MKKVRHYEGESFEFHQKALAKKREGNTKTVVSGMEKLLDDVFATYKDRFESDSLQNLSALNVTTDQEQALKDMYSYSAKIFRDLKTALTTDENGRQSVLCPNCTIETVGSFDHLLPQSEFPEFSDNPLNLIVCCTTCNSKKNAVWRQDGERIFLNLYLDDLPNIQYLFVDFDLSIDPPIVTYAVRNDNNIDSNLYLKIENHYKKLDLCKRFKESSDDLIGDLEYEISQYKAILPVSIIKVIIKNKAADWQRRYGYNYWKSIFYIACCDNEAMFNYLYSR